MQHLSDQSSKIIIMDFSTKFTKAFQVFKEGKTNGWITILIPTSGYCNEIHETKKAFYINLGYLVK